MPRKRSGSHDAHASSTQKRKKSATTLQPARTYLQSCHPKAGDSESWLLDLLNDQEWKTKLAPCFSTEKFKKMEAWLKEQYKHNDILPPKSLIFNAFNMTRFANLKVVILGQDPYHNHNELKVVILGQDPYHNHNEAHGLAFSVPRGVAVPPSLKNIYKELVTDVPGFSIPEHGCLENWAQQGVLLLNAALTVEAHKPNSHARCGWWEFTDAVIRTISDHCKPCVFLLWGGFAQKKEKLVDCKRHRVIKSAHPSPLSFNKFKNCHCFSNANKMLQKLGREPVDWTVNP